MKKDDNDDLDGRTLPTLGLFLEERRMLDGLMSL